MARDKGTKGPGCQETLRKYRALGMSFSDGHIQKFPRRHDAQNMSAGMVIFRGLAGALLGWEHREERYLAPSVEISIIRVIVGYHLPSATTRKSGGVGKMWDAEGGER